MPYVLVNESIIKGMDFTNTGQIGDTIGGTTAPFIGLSVALLTFCAFWVQYTFNVQQEKRLHEQEVLTKKDHFENRFYDLLRFHRENVSEISFNRENASKKVFTSMFKELRFIYKIADRIRQVQLIEIENEDLYSVVYSIFMYGVGIYSDSLVDSNINKDLNAFTDILRKELKSMKSSWRNRKEYYPILAGEKPIKKDFYISEDIIFYKIKENTNIALHCDSLPFEGYSSVLELYTKQLAYLFKYIDEQDEKIITEKQNYADIVNIQLSAYEHLIIYYNSISIFNDVWKLNDTNLLNKYKILKNVPVPLADFYIVPDK